ncbi:hypothetical protein BCR33DRAFT_857278 [Rhizoclosmatium globosum]|uniref:Uncharacterized protein n=1 Tax=Rhizoclosmatium globosum TaxID=329046 RepID=A0A1Y2B871_9FUNG|nr:hypothetical protein BCR33DRAFT_857278 [Rhizoclosmatium globosum]|eukprot:ORY30730.1 hypothetical protein BCR33DRAFT_857278 [Rhizoclosmatium globosum]
MPSLPHTERQALRSKSIEKGSVESYLAIFALCTMIAACVYIFFIAVKSALVPILDLAKKQKALREAQEGYVSQGLKMNPAQYRKRIAELEESDTTVYSPKEGEDEFDAMLDEMIEKERRRGIPKRVSSLTADVPAVDTGLRKRTAKASVPLGDAELRHREMIKNLKDIYDFDNDDEHDEDSDDDAQRNPAFSNDIRV